MELHFFYPLAIISSLVTELESKTETKELHQVELNEQIRKLESQADQLERRRCQDTSKFDTLENEKLDFINDMSNHFKLTELSPSATLSTVFNSLKSKLAQQDSEIKDRSRNFLTIIRV